MLPSQFIRALEFEKLRGTLQEYHDKLSYFLNSGESSFSPEFVTQFIAFTYKLSIALASARLNPAVEAVFKSMKLVGYFAPEAMANLAGIRALSNAAQLRQSQLYSPMVMQQAAIETLLGLHNAATLLLGGEAAGPNASTLDLVVVDFDGNGILLSRVESIAHSTRQLNKYFSRVYSTSIVEPRILLAESGSDWHMKINTGSQVCIAISTALTFFYLNLKSLPADTATFEIRGSLSKASIQEAIKGLSADARPTAESLTPKLAGAFDSLVANGVAPYEEDYHATRQALVRHKPALLISAESSLNTEGDDDEDGGPNEQNAQDAE
ncbi:MAG: hypothetical protein Q8922_01435 [Bacteroidota bacterium]|nr:hypothetical protein [Bacteroidota bacterium]MDP4232110.1 hypothetical protein [Bacteroidota bacterium]MDP4241182.1 hypothetical protein [Bacteroidota bacterium]MDP4286574.1 hypothetical protein [Bacteroidota bacterium]